MTIVSEHEPVEVTTYRADGAYGDHRHPDGVRFVSDITEDLSRRDFTMNAMALVLDDPDSPLTLVDPFHGSDDVRSHVIRTVGDPYKRFSEDALRIMRAMRFSSTLGFTIDTETGMAMLGRRNLESLDRVSIERKTSELVKTLAGKDAFHALMTCREVVFQVIPELRELDGFDQRTRWHQHDAWEHTCRTVHAVDDKENVSVLVAALLHDCAKPDTFTYDERGGHFYGHDQFGADKASIIMRGGYCTPARLRLPSRTIRRVETLIRHHEFHQYDEASMRRLLRHVSEETDTTDESFEAMRELLMLRRADIIAHGDTPALAELEPCQACDVIINRLQKGGECLHTSDLAIDGNDVMGLGIPQGPEVGHALRKALDAVADGVPNERYALLQFLSQE